MTAPDPQPFFSLLLGCCQTTVNRWITQSSAACDELRELEGRSMIVDVEKTSWRIGLRVEQRQVRIREVAEDTVADIVIRAGLPDLVAILRARSLSQLRAGEVEFRGTLRIAERFSQMLRLARPSLEDEMAGWIGDMPARALARVNGAAVGWGTKTVGALESDVAEFLQAETSELPRPREVAEFLREVERLRDDVDRIGQRIERLAAGALIVDST